MGVGYVAAEASARIIARTFRGNPSAVLVTCLDGINDAEARANRRKRQTARVSLGHYPGPEHQMSLHGIPGRRYPA
jgi:hypothetical protein